MLCIMVGTQNVCFKVPRKGYIPALSGDWVYRGLEFQGYGAELTETIDVAIGDTLAFKITAGTDSYEIYNIVQFFDKVFPGTTANMTLGYQSDIINVAGGTATLDGVPIVSGVTALPTDGAEHEIVFTYSVNSNLDKIMGNAYGLPFPMYDIVLTTVPKTYSWPVHITGSTITEANEGLINIELNALGYSASNWYDKSDIAVLVDPVYYFESISNDTLPFDTVVPMFAGSTIEIKFMAPEHASGIDTGVCAIFGFNSAVLNQMLYFSSGNISFLYGTATLDGVPIVHQVTPVPFDGLEHTLVYTSNGGIEDFIGLGHSFGGADIGLPPMRFYDLVVNNGTVYSWPMRDNAQVMVEENFGVNDLTMGSGYKASRWVNL
jgi:hypothetical protein